MLVISNLAILHLLALTVQCLSPFQPNDKQNVGTNSDLLFYIIQKYDLQMMQSSILCLGVLLCIITPREITNTSLFCCNESHFLLTFKPENPLFGWLISTPPSQALLHVSYWESTTLIPSPFSGVSHWSHSLHSAH